MIFELIKDYEEEMRPGLTHVYNKANFYVQIQPTFNKDLEFIEIEVSLIDIESEAIVKRFPDRKFTPDGELGPVKNQAEIEAWAQQLAILKQEREQLREEVKQAQQDRDKEARYLADGVENPVWKQKDKDLKKKQKDFDDKVQEFNTHQANQPEPQRDMINFLSEVKGAFDLNTDTLTSEGKKWIKTLKTGGLKIGDQIDVQ